MPFYTDADQLYEVARELFSRIVQQNPHAADSLLSSRLVARLKCEDPTAEFMLNGRKRPMEITYGNSHTRPTLDIELPADMLHRILLDEISLTKALGSGQLKVRGPVWKASALADLFANGQEIYTQILSERGFLADGH